MIHRIEIEQTASTGAWSFNTQKWEGAADAYLEQIVVIATTVSTGFHFSIKDGSKNLLPVYDTTLEGSPPTGYLIETVHIPLVGVYTIAVSASENDEAFTGVLYVSENSGAY